MSVAENVGFYGDGVTDDPLDGKTPTVQFRLYILNYHPASSLVRLRHYPPHSSIVGRCSFLQSGYDRLELTTEPGFASIVEG